jgi:molybdopterin molybdotransferase
MGSQSWGEARSCASAAGPRLPAVSVPLDGAEGMVLAEGIRARCDLPPFDTSAMDGWAVSGRGPWRIRYEAGLAGSIAAPLRLGEAAAIATGACLPDGTTAVIRREDGTITEQGLLAGTAEHGRDIRPRGQECLAGDELLAAGTVVTPAVLGLAAAGGYDELPVIRRPRVGLCLLGDELLASGLPLAGRVRDSLGPLLPGWLRRLGAELTSVRYVADKVEALQEAVAAPADSADVIVTTGGTARGPVDHLHTVLAAAGASLLVDGARVRPGHPMLLAQLEPARFLVGLPGNPLAAVSGVLTLLAPLLTAMQGREPGAARAIRLADAATGHPTDTRLIPVRDGVPLHYAGPAMLRGFALADGMAVIPPGGVAAGTTVELLALPWS